MSKHENKELGLPRFQRFESWDNKKISDLLTSVLRDLPVGSCLVLGVENDLQFAYRYLGETEPVEKIQSNKTAQVTELLLDGQQRITALWKALNRKYYPDIDYMVRMEGDAGEIEVIAKKRSIKGDKIHPLWIDSPAECWKQKFFPVFILNPEDEPGYDNWCESASEGNAKLQIEIQKRINPLRSRLSQFNIPFLLLPKETRKEVAIDVFIKMNTSYQRLTTFDILVAQFEEIVKKDLHNLVNELSANSKGISRYTSDLQNFFLAVAALRQNRQPNQQGFNGLDLKKVDQDWGSITRGTKELVTFLEQEKIFDSARLPTEPVLTSIAALFSEMSNKPDHIGNVRILMRKYLWRAFLTSRYDRAVATRILQDYRELLKIVTGADSNARTEIFNDREYPTPQISELIKAGWPKKRDRLARAILLLSFKGGALDFADEKSISADDLKNREYHHVFPDAYLIKKGFNEHKDRFRALNCALVTWRTNRTIGATKPIEYLLERTEASSLGENQIKYRLKTHALNYDAIVKDDYDEFLIDRAKTYLDAIADLCDGKNWTPKL